MHITFIINVQYLNKLNDNLLALPGREIEYW